MNTISNLSTGHTPFFRRLALVAATLTAFAVTPALFMTSAHAAPKKSAAVSPEAVPTGGDADAASDDTSGVVNLNTATETELMLLPGVGPSKAAAIIAFRKKYGSFKKVDDLNKVKGFGYKTLKKLKPHLAVAGATTYKGKAKKTGTRSDEASAASVSSAEATPQ